MKNSYFAPINYINGKVRIPLKLEDLRDDNVYEEMWLDGDNKEEDIQHLIEQNRIKL